MRKVGILSSVHLALDNRIFYREARSLQRAGYDVTLIAVHERDEVKDGIRIRPLPQVPRTRRPLLWRTLLTMAREIEADIYHFHDPELLLVMPWLRQKTGKPTIYDIHEVYADFIKVKDYMPAWLRYPIAWNFSWLEPLLARFQDGLIFADDQIARAFSRISIPKTTLYNFPSYSFIKKAAEASVSIQSREPVILYLGAMERSRGTALMLEAFARVRAALPEARLLLVGHFAPPTLEQMVRGHAADLGLAQAVTITGRVPFDEVGHYLKQAAVGWVPFQPVPKYEKNIATKLFEYMAYGVPVVSSDLPSTRPFIVDGENGHLVTATDPEAHAAAIQRILQAPGRARLMGRRGRELVRERYNWAEMEKRLLALYAQVGAG